MNKAEKFDYMKQNIVLIGMPASGKSTAGVILAKLLAMDFVDTDIVLQQREGCRLRDIIEAKGIEPFLKKEERAVLSISARHTVIATGGSVVYSDAAMKHLKENAMIIYLKVGFGKMRKRLGDLRKRGVILRNGETLKEMYDERCVLYEKYADIVLCEKGAVEDTVRMIVGVLNGGL